MIQVDLRLWQAFVLELDEETFRPLYEATKGLTYTLCLRLLRHAEDASDAFQATYCQLLAVARDPALAREVDDVTTLLYLLARREADNLRKRQRRRAVREQPLEETQVISNDQISPEFAIEQAELRARIESLVEALPDRYRLPVLLHYFHGLSQRDVARALGESVSTISDRIRAALKKLAQPCRSAGLGDAASTLAGIALAAVIAQPSLSAGAIFSQVQAAAVSAETQLALSAKAPPIVTGGTIVATLVKPKVTLLAAIVLCSGFLLGGFMILRSSGPKLEPQPLVMSSTAPAEEAVVAPASHVDLANSDGNAVERPVPIEVSDVISGFVRDVETGAPIPGALVRSGDHEALVDLSGSYTLRDVGRGMHTVTASAHGYAKRPANIASRRRPSSRRASRRTRSTSARTPPSRRPAPRRSTWTSAPGTAPRRE
jgi:RNA polymerase sigma factor (sigma-70 family)